MFNSFANDIFACMPFKFDFDSWWFASEHECDKVHATPYLGDIPGLLKT